MLSNKKVQVALAIGWFVLVDILLRTTEGAIGNVSSISSTFRGLLRGLSSSYSSLYIGIAGLLILAALVLLVLFFIFGAWTSVINVTRVLVKLLFSEDTSDADKQQVQEKELFQDLFGKDVLKSRNALLWRTLRNLFAIWILILLITLLVGIINSISPY